MKKNILLVGGSGYIGSVVVNYLLNKNYHIICYDDFIYNHEYVIKNFLKKNFNKNFTFLKDSLKNINYYKKYFLNLDAVVMLASVVGDPITKKYPIFANEVNVKQTKKFINSLIYRFMF